MILIVMVIAGMIPVTVYLLTIPKVTILTDGDGEIRITTDYENIGVYPAKIKIESLPKEYRLQYKVTNYSDETVDIMVYNKVPNKIEKGYVEYENTDIVYLVIPEKEFTVEGGDMYETEIIIGCPVRNVFEKKIEMWIGFKSMREKHSLELTSRILLER
jgi:hypothetical protein